MTENKGEWMSLKIGTRRSQLAMWQAHAVRDALVAAQPDRVVEIIEIVTRGDKIQDRPLSAVGGKGLFVKEIEAALIDGAIDIAVHSAKDLPGEMPAGLILGGVLPRADARDAWVCRSGQRLDELPPGSIVGTSSVRRRAMVLAQRPDLEVISLRGNLDTRLRKVREGYDGITAAVLAQAGIDRMIFGDAVVERFDFDRFLPAVGQGIVAIQCRAEDQATLAALAAISCPKAAAALRAERAFSATLDGSCHVPLAAHAEIDDEGRLELRAAVLHPEGSQRIEDVRRGPIDRAQSLGRDLAHALLAAGGRALMQGELEPKPVADLVGCRVINTRPKERAAHLTKILRDRGAEVIDAPLIELHPTLEMSSMQSLEAAARGEFDWLVLTSPMGVEVITPWLPRLAKARVFFAVVGERTKEVLRGYGIAADLVPVKEQAEGLAEAMSALIEDRPLRVLIAGSAKMRATLAEALTEAGAEVVIASTYEPRAVAEQPALEALEAEAGALLVASPSAVDSLFSLCERAEATAALQRWAFIAIGSVTAAALAKHQVEPAAVASTPSSQGLVDAVARWAASREP